MVMIRESVAEALAEEEGYDNIGDWRTDHDLIHCQVCGGYTHPDNAILGENGSDDDWTCLKCGVLVIALAEEIKKQRSQD